MTLETDEYNQKPDIEVLKRNKADKSELDGEWTNASIFLVEDFINLPSGQLTFDLSDYLPNDSVYEIIISGEFRTGTSSGNAIDVNLVTDLCGIQFVTAVARTNNYAPAAGVIILPLKEKKIILDNTGGVGKIGWLGINAYRKVK